MEQNPLGHPAVFRRLVVEPNVEELADDFANVRKALNAVLSVDALAAHIYWWGRINVPSLQSKCPGDDSGYRADLANQNQSFELLRDCAKALKHVRLTRSSPKVAEANKMKAIPIGYGMGPFGRGRFGGVPQVILQVNELSFDYVESIIIDCLEILEAEMIRLGCNQE